MRHFRRPWRPRPRLRRWSGGLRSSSQAQAQRIRGALDSQSWQLAAEANPLARLAEPGQVAALVAFLLLAETEHVTGALLPVNGGLTLM
jgi:NAD(P)-dependent dehydrogenase (short-subunit alcohol dehydrogenase family)